MISVMYGRDLADPGAHLWGAFWMDPAAIPAAPESAAEPLYCAMAANGEA
jgi:hypothetical protein